MFQRCTRLRDGLEELKSMQLLEGLFSLYYRLADLLYTSECLSCLRPRGLNAISVLSNYSRIKLHEADQDSTRRMHKFLCRLRKRRGERKIAIVLIKAESNM